MEQPLQDSLPSLPGSLVDSYKQYKTDTNSFSTWLANSGVNCGYHLSTNNQPTPQSPGSSLQKSTHRLKGKARKLAKEAEVQSSLRVVLKTLLLRDYVPLAKHIASFTKPRVLVPQSVIKKLERAILLRRQCASWFQSRAQQIFSLTSNDTHQHFIEVLQTALKLLEPLGNQVTDPGQMQDIDSVGSRRTENEDPQLQRHNRFEALTIESIDEDEDSELLTQPKTHGKAEKISLVQNSHFVPEQQSQKDEFMLGCFCFFQDLRGVRCHLQELWQRYKEKQVTLVTASLVTTAAFDFVRRAEQTFMSTFSQSGDYFDCFVDQMFRQACEVQGQPFPVKRETEITATNVREAQPYADNMADEAEWIMLPTWRLLLCCTKLYLKSENEAEAGYNITPLPEDYIASIWDEYGYSADRQDRHLFDQLLLGTGMMTFNNQFDVIGIDVFRDGLIEMKETRVISAWLVFATQNFLDIQHILKEEVSRGLHELASTCEAIRHKVQQHIAALEPLAQVNNWHEHDYEWLQKYRTMLVGDNCKNFQTLFLMHPLGAGLREFYAVAWFRLSGIRMPE